MSGRVVLITGANQGLGYAVIEVGAARFPVATWILAARDPAKGQQAAEELQSKVPKAQIQVLKLDVTDDSDISAAVEQVTKEHGKLDVLINNAGQCIMPTGNAPSEIRKAFNDNCNLNLTSAAVLTESLLPLLHKAPKPKVLNITSGLASIQNALNSKMMRFPPYGGAKVGMNGMTAHQQSREVDRVKAEEDGSQPKSGNAFVKWYIINPGIMKTAFTRFSPRGRDPKESAEPVLRIAFDDKDEYEYAKNWEWVAGEMRIVPW